MNKRSLWVTATVLVILAFGAATYYSSLPTRWDKAVARCMEGGDGDTFTDRQLCEQRYDRNTGERRAEPDPAIRQPQASH